MVSKVDVTDVTVRNAFSCRKIQDLTNNVLKRELFIFLIKKMTGLWVLSFPLMVSRRLQEPHTSHHILTPCSEAGSRW